MLLVNPFAFQFWEFPDPYQYNLMQNSNSTTYMHVIFQKKKNEMENFAHNNFRYWTVEHTVCNAKMPYCTLVIPSQCEWFTAWYNSQILYLDKCFDQISRQHYIFFNTTNHTLYKYYKVIHSYSFYSKVELISKLSVSLTQTQSFNQFPTKIFIL